MLEEPLAIRPTSETVIGTMYANRESVTFGSANELPLAYNYILQLFENYDVWC
jgi:prolyl-tRNA synthetase